MASPKKDVISFISSTSLNVLACQKTRYILKSVHWIKIPSFIFLDFRLSIKQNWYEKSADEGASKNDLVPSFKLHRYLRKRSKSSQSVKAGWIKFNLLETIESIKLAYRREQ